MRMNFMALLHDDVHLLREACGPALLARHVPDRRLLDLRLPHVIDPAELAEHAIVIVVAIINIIIVAVIIVVIIISLYPS